MIFRFANCAMASRSHELRVSDALVHLEPQVWDVLDFLIRHRDRVVTREELSEAIWDGRVVSDGVISARIFAARRALGDDGITQSLIKTIPRRGYRFVAEVSLEEEEGQADGEDGEPPAVLARRTPNGRRMAAIGAGAFLIAVAVGAGWWAAPQVRGTAGTAERIAAQIASRPSIAVLPFRDLSPEDDLARLGQSLSGAVITALARSPALFVITQGSTLKYSGAPDAVENASAELNVTYVVVGNLVASEDRIRVEVQLVDTSSNSVLWAERYAGSREDLLALEKDISARIAQSLGVQLIHGGNASLGDTRNLEALAKFADAQAAYQAFTPHGNLAARTLYREAVAIDPSFARALVGVANTHLIEMFEAPAEDWAGQINTISRLSERAARQAPGLPELYKLRSMLALARGDQDLALAEAEAMVTLDPNGAESHYTLGQMLFFAGHYGRAIENLRVAERLNPNRRASYSSHLAFALLAEGKIDAAVRVLQEVREKWPDYVPGSAYLAIAYQLSGREGDARGTARLSNGDGAATFSMRAIERRFAPMRDRALARRLIDAARAAGIPDCCGLDPD